MNTLIKISSLFTVISLLFISCKSETQNTNLPDGIYAVIETSKGNITAQLAYDKTPYTVANFITLAEGKNEFVDAKHKGIHYYDGLTFHRVEMNPPVIQGGDPNGNGSGGPGYKFKDEFHPSLKHSKIGMLSMANAGPNTNGSQFFISLDAIPYLDGAHSVFGEVVEGLDVLPNIAVGDEIISITILRKGTQAKKFDAVKIFNDYFKKEQELQKELEQQTSKIKATKTAAFQNVKTTGTKTKSGLIYKIIQKGTTKKPVYGNEVFVNYGGFFEDGSLFDTNIESLASQFGKLDPQRAAQKGYVPMGVLIGDQASMIPGFIEAIENLKFGEKMIAIIPSHIGYGKSGAGEIPPNTTLYFEIELLNK